MTHANGTTNFPNLGLVKNVKFTGDITVVYTNDSIHRVCFPDSNFSDPGCLDQIRQGSTILIIASVGKLICSQTHKPVLKMLIKCMTKIIELYHICSA